MKQLYGILMVGLVITVFSGCGGNGSSPTSKENRQASEYGNLNIISSAFAHNESIPAYYTCDGEDLSPPLAWSGVPQGTQSFTLIVDDPDAPDPKAPKVIWVHWVLYNIPSATTALSEAITELPGSTREGLNDWKRTGYNGPCPPVGRHRYFHKLYALDVVLPEMEGATKAQVEDAMQGHILAQTELIGTYQRAE